MDSFLKILEHRVNNVSNDSIKNMLNMGIDSMRMFEQEQKNDECIQNTISIRLLSSELPSGQIELRQLTETLSAFESIQENGTAALFGFEGKRGKIPKDILDRNKLIITSTRAGSFIVDLGLREGQLSMFDTENHIPTSIIGDVSDLLEEKINIEEFIETYNSRTFNSVKKLVSKLSKESLGIELLDNVNNSNRLFAKDTIKKMNHEFRGVHITKSDTLTVRGDLIKVDLATQKITLNNSEGQITIKVKDDEIKNHHLTTNETYEVRTNVKKVIRRSGSSETYTTSSVKNIVKL